jgi:hypothetical protein
MSQFQSPSLPRSWLPVCPYETIRISGMSVPEHSKFKKGPLSRPIPSHSRPMVERGEHSLG